jgi:long-subunit fatty acid transport protein
MYRGRSTFFRHRRLALGLVVSALVAAPAAALTDEEVFRDFRFNLISPGARARGIGGAFVSLADDATAAQSNPAGLSFLRRSEFFAELRMVDNADKSTVINEMLPSGLDTFVASGTSIDDGTNLSFLSGVLARRRWSLGISRQEVINISNSTLSSYAFQFQDTPGVFLVEGTGNIDAQAVNWNLSGGYRITDRFSLGATAAYATLEVNSLVTNTIVDTEGTLTGQVPVLEPALDLQTQIDDTDSDWIFNIGLLYRVQDKWSIGAMYREGPSFSVTETIPSAADANKDGSPDGMDLFAVTERLGTSFVQQFSLPDTFAVGGSVNVTGRLTVSGDVDYIRYSNLLEGYLPGVNAVTGPDAVFTIDDAYAFRAGAEYVFPNRRSKFPPLALRGGLYTEESSTIRAVSTGSETLASEEVFTADDLQEHLTLGMGFAMKRVKLDFAFDFAEIDNEFLLSFIYQGK